MGVDTTSKLILAVSSTLDSYGAKTWNLRVIAVISALILIPIYRFAGKKGGVEWHGLLHALITGIGGLMCVYLDFYASESLTGKPEPLNMAQCGGPMTTLHRILPSITLGYSITDVYNGFSLGKTDFILHGFATSIVMLIFCELNVPHMIVQMLIMEVSTIFLCMFEIEAGPSVQLIVQVMFALTFFLFRVLLSPYILIKLIIALLNDRDVDCFHPLYVPIVVGFSVFFCGLNFFWFYKIVRKIRRMLSGEKKKKETKKDS